MNRSERLLLLFAGFFFGAIFGALAYRELTIKEPAVAGAPIDPAAQGGGPAGRVSDGQGGATPPGAGPSPGPGPEGGAVMSGVLQRLAELKKQPDRLENQLELGRMYMTVQKFPQAREWLEKARRQSPRDPDLLMDLAVCRLRSDDAPGAESLFRAALQEKPRMVEAMYGLATVAWGARGDAKAALAWLDRIEKLNPKFDGLAELRDAIAQGARSRRVSAPPPPSAPGAGR